MEIDEYVSKRLAAVEEETAQILDFRVFDFSYVPDKLLVREEARPIIDALVKFSRTRIPQNLVILGSRGCGKTLLLKYLQRVLGERAGLEILYANCRNHNTSFKIIAGILGAPMRGTSLQELYGRFENKFPGPAVVILDEVDLISKKDPNKDILYFLSRAERPYMVVCLSNNPRFLSELDTSVRSSLQAETRYLKNYDANQVNEILRLRAEAGLATWDEACLGQVAALTVQRTNSDVRVAIKTLFYAVTEADTTIEACFDSAQRDIYIDLISDLNDKNLLILRSVQMTADPFVKKIFSTYEQLSRDLGEAPFSYVYFLNNLSYMQSIGLILLIQTKVNRSYTSTVSLLFNVRVLRTIFRMRFGR